jgi:hypothetical protein
MVLAGLPLILRRPSWQWPRRRVYTWRSAVFIALGGLAFVIGLLFAVALL